MTDRAPPPGKGWGNAPQQNQNHDPWADMRPPGGGGWGQQGGGGRPPGVGGGGWGQQGGGGRPPGVGGGGWGQQGGGGRPPGVGGGGGGQQGGGGRPPGVGGGRNTPSTGGGAPPGVGGGGAVPPGVGGGRTFNISHAGQNTTANTPVPVAKRVSPKRTGAAPPETQLWLPVWLLDLVEKYRRGTNPPPAGAGVVEGAPAAPRNIPDGVRVQRLNLMITNLIQEAEKFTRANNGGHHPIEKMSPDEMMFNNEPFIIDGAVSTTTTAEEYRLKNPIKISVKAQGDYVRFLVGGVEELRIDKRDARRFPRESHVAPDAGVILPPEDVAMTKFIKKHLVTTDMADGDIVSAFSNRSRNACKDSLVYLVYKPPRVGDRWYLSPLVSTDDTPGTCGIVPHYFRKYYPYDWHDPLFFKQYAKEWKNGAVRWLLGNRRPKVELDIEEEIGREEARLVDEAKARLAREMEGELRRAKETARRTVVNRATAAKTRRTVARK